jgi:cytochrome c oxidase assembly factor CtaG
MRHLIFAAVAAWTLLRAGTAQAHSPLEHGSWWTPDPIVWIPIGVVVALYVAGLRAQMRRPIAFGQLAGWRIGSMVLALTALAFALLWPLDALAEASLAAHMAQHMLLMAVAAPLLAVARPDAQIAAALPRQWSRRLGSAIALWDRAARPRFAFSFHAACIWLGHAPAVIALTLSSSAFHTFHHMVLLASAILFWWAVRSRRRHPGAGVLWIFLTMLHTGLLGALLTFAPRPLYPAYAVLAHDAMADQQLAGLIMWVPGGALYLLAGLVHTAAWLRPPRAEPVAASMSSPDDLR